MRKLYKLVNQKNTIINFGYLADMTKTRSYLAKDGFEIKELERSEALKLWRSYRDQLRNNGYSNETFLMLDQFIND